MFYNHIVKKHKEIQKQIQTLKNKISALPEGKFVCSRSGNTYKWYQSDGVQKIYIPKKKRRLAEQLAAKKYLSYKLDDLLKENTALEFYLRHHSNDIGKADNLLLSNSGYQELLAPYFKPKSQELHEWMYEDYRHNPLYPEQLIHKTASGNLVRSKSEAMIDLCLYKNNIPFRYECEFQLGASIIYPDFTIRHPKTGEFYYYEHFGLMDNPSYSQRAFSKLTLYASHRIIPTIQLITTYETQEHPLTFETVENLISYYFL